MSDGTDRRIRQKYKTYRQTGWRKTLALGTYPEVSLIKARQRCVKARELLADGIDPMQAKREGKAAVPVKTRHGSDEALGGAYDRTQFHTERVKLMTEWADYLDKLRLGADVIQFKAA